MSRYPYVWTRAQLPKGRKGQRCRRVGKSKAPGLCKIQFSKPDVTGEDTYHVDERGLVKLVDVEAAGGWRAWLRSKVQRGSP